jgi:hypothetical protein
MPSKLQDINFASIVEEFFLACLDLKLIEWAQIFLKAICILFPDKIKTMRLLGMWYEA